MKESPNKADPTADIELIVEELLSLFTSAETNDQPEMILHSAVGSTFHARVLNAAKHLDLLP
jgi:hypothetical protein